MLQSLGVVVGSPSVYCKEINKVGWFWSPINKVGWLRDLDRSDWSVKLTQYDWLLYRVTSFWVTCPNLIDSVILVQIGTSVFLTQILIGCLNFWLSVPFWSYFWLTSPFCPNFWLTDPFWPNFWLTESNVTQVMIDWDQSDPNWRFFITSSDVTTIVKTLPTNP